MESVTTSRTRGENKSLNKNIVASEFELKSKSVRQLLTEMNNIYGISKEEKETIKIYADYIRLRKQNKITVGSANILINCNSNRNYIGIVNVLTKLLYKTGIIELPRYEVLTDVHISKNNNINEKELYVIDDESLKSYKLDKMLYDNSSAVFIILCSDKNIKEIESTTNNFYWFITLSEPTAEEKITYIKNTIKENGFDMKLNNKECLALASLDMETLDRFLMNAFIIGNKKKLQYITREELNRKPKPPKEGMQKLNNMIGLDEVKEQVKQIINYIEIHKQRGALPTLNMVFKGNPRNRENGSSKNNWRDICRLWNIRRKLYRSIKSRLSRWICRTNSYENTKCS